MSLNQLSALEISARVREGELCAREMLDASLAQIRAVDGVPGSLEKKPLDPAEEQKVHAFIRLTENLARQQADEIDRKVSAGEDPGMLAGVPVSIKDIFTLQGIETTAASRILWNFKPPYTATPVQKLIDAGALILGKANLDEFTFGSSSESSAFTPAPNNPWDPNRVPGGSSGGSTASVAAEEVTLSLGTDTGGSIRQPAAFCGVVGLKPTYGRVSRYGLMAFSSSLDCPGPIARNVSDAALMLQAIAGNDPKDSTSSVVPTTDYLEALKEGVKGLRVGLSPDYAHLFYPDFETGELAMETIQAEISDAVLHAASVLANLGAEIVENVPLPNAKYSIPTYFVVSRVEAASNLHRFDGVKYGYRTPVDVEDLQDLIRRTRAEGFGSEVKLRILMGMYLSSEGYAANYYQRALKVRAMIRRDFDRAFDPHGEHRLDVILTPTTATTAFKRNDVFGNTVRMQYSDQMTVSANHAGLPAVSIPGGLDAEKLPIGIQFIGPDFREDLILRAGFAYEQATLDEAWRAVRPAVLRQEVAQ